MRFISAFLAAISAFLFTVSGLNESVVGYTEGKPLEAVRQDYCFDNEPLLIGGYYGGEGLAKLAKEAGLDFWIDGGVTEKELDECYENGIGVIATDYNLRYFYAYLDRSGINGWLNIDKNKYKDHPALWGDNLIDEPSAACFDDMQAAVSSYRTAFPDKMAYINLFPAYANEEQLGETHGLTIIQKVLCAFSEHSKEYSARYKKHISDYINKIDTDYICADIYPYSSTRNSQGEVKATCEMWVRNLDILAEACRATGRDLWIITQAAGETIDGNVYYNANGEQKSEMRYCDEVTDISQQAYASLAFGTKAIIHGLFAGKGWWDNESHMLDKNGNKTDTYYAVQTVDSWLKNFANVYGRFNYRSTYAINPSRIAGYGGGELATTIDSEKINLSSTKGLLVGTFDGRRDSKAYVVTNMEELNNMTSAKFIYTAPEGANVTMYRKNEIVNLESGKPVTVVLEPGEGVFITVNDVCID